MRRLGLLRGEWLELNAGRSLLFWTAAALLLAGVAGWRGGTSVRSQQDAIRGAAEHEESVTAELDRLFLTLTGPNPPRDVPWYQDPRDSQALSYLLVRYVSRPPRVGALFAIGQSDLLPYNFRILPHPPDRWTNQQELANPVWLALGSFDLAFLVIHFLPIVVIALTYAVIARERESGMLGLLLAQAGSLRKLALLKFGFRTLISGALVLVLLTAGWITSGILPDGPVEAIEAGAIIGIAFLYIILWCALALLVVSFRLPATTNVVVLGSLWLVFTFLVPAGIEVSANRRYPTPGMVEEFLVTLAADRDARAREGELVDQHVARYPETAQLLKDPDALLITPTNLLVADEVRRLTYHYRRSSREQHAARRAWTQRFAVLSPALVTQSAITRLAGTGVERYRSFQNQVEDYHSDLQNLFKPLLMVRAQLDEPLAVPHFEFAEPPRLETAIAASSAALYLFSVASFLVGVGLLRMRTRS